MGRQRHGDEVFREREHVTPIEHSGEREFQAALRPECFDDYVGQRDLVANLRVSVQAAQKGGWALDHFLFAGPPGLGKTTLAHVIANELGVKLHVTSGPAIDHKGMLASLLTSLGERDVLFIDEIHRLNPLVEENLYPAMEDFRFDLFNWRWSARKSGGNAVAQVYVAWSYDQNGTTEFPIFRSFWVSLAVRILRAPRPDRNRRKISSVVADFRRKGWGGGDRR